MSPHHQSHPRQVNLFQGTRSQRDAASKQKFSPAPAFPAQQAAGSRALLAQRNLTIRDPGGRVPRDRFAAKCLSALTGFMYTRQSVKWRFLSRPHWAGSQTRKEYTWLRLQICKTERRQLLGHADPPISERREDRFRSGRKAERSLLSGYKPNRINWLELSSNSDWESNASNTCKMGTFSRHVMLRICRIW